MLNKSIVGFIINSHYVFLGRRIFCKKISCFENIVAYRYAINNTAVFIVFNIDSRNLLIKKRYKVLVVFGVNAVSARILAEGEEQT